MGHHGIDIPQVADEEGLQMWRTDTNIMYSISSGGQLTTGGPPAWGLGRRLTARRKKPVPLDLGLGFPHMKAKIRREGA